MHLQKRKTATMLQHNKVRLPTVNMAATNYPKEYGSIRRSMSLKRSRKRQERPLLASMLLFFLTIPSIEPHRSRLPRQRSSVSLGPSFAPSSIDNITTSDVNDSLTPSISISPSTTTQPSPSNFSESSVPTPTISLAPLLSPSISISPSSTTQPSATNFSESSLPTPTINETDSNTSLIPSMPTSAFPSLSPSISSMPSQLPSNVPTFSLVPSQSQDNSTLEPTQTTTSEPTDVIPFRTVPCTYDSNVTGYQTVESLTADLAEYQVEQPYILCPNTTFADLELIVGSSRQDIPLNMTCGGTDCVWTGQEHLVVTASDVVITMKGITYVGSSSSSSSQSPSIVVGAHQNVQANFVDCTWMQNRGNETIRIGGPRHDSNKTDTEIVEEGRLLQQGGEVLVSFSKCSFVDNEALDAVMASYSGELILDECEFTRNVVQEGSLILAEGSILELQDLTMIGNNVTTGLVYIGENATLSSTSGGICSLSNNAQKNDTNSSGTCEGINLEDADNCLALGECETQTPSLSPTAGSVAPSTAPSFVPRACYSTLGSLKSAIELAATQTNERETIRVCAGAVLDGNTEWEHSPIEIKSGSLRFECGTTGSHSDNCMIFGGDIQIRIGPGAGRVLFSGFTLVDAKQVSVLAAGSATTEGLFEDCQWKMNNGIAGVLVYNEADGEPYNGQRNLEQLPAPSSPSMSVDFDNCYFEGNFFSFAALVLVRGHSFLHSTVFRDNKTSRLGTVGVTQGSSLGISSSCFMQNQALVDGIIMVDATSNITRNVQNYGEDNESLLGICGSVFDDLSGTCAIDGTCHGNCLPFNANECGVPLSDRTLGPTPPPVVAPTPVPEFPPTVTSEPGSSGDPETGDGGGGGESNEEGKSAGSIVMAVILVLVVFSVGFWFWRRGRQKDKAANKKNQAANKKRTKEEKKKKDRKGKDAEKDKRLAAIKNKASKRYDDDEEFYDEDDSYSDDSDQSSQSAEKKKGWFGFMGGSNHEDKKKKREHKKKVKGERKSKKKEKKKGKGSKSSKKKKDDSEIEERSNYESDEASEDAASEASEVSAKKKDKDEESNDKKSPKKKLFKRSSSSGSSAKSAASAASKKSAKSEEEKMEEGEASSVES